MRGLFVSFAFVAALMFGSIAHAEPKLNMDGLSESAQAELALKAAELRKAALDTPVIPDVVEMEKYVSVGEQIGKALATTAKELGIEVNNFATTPVGMIAIFLIVWHFFGAMMLHLAFGSVWFVTMVPLWVYFFKRIAMNREETFDAKGKRTAIKHSLEETSADTIAVFTCAALVIFAVGIFGIFSY